MKAHTIEAMLMLISLSLATAVAAQTPPPFPVDPSLTEPAVLRYQFPAGATDSYRMVMTQTMTMTGVPEAAEMGAMVMQMAFTTNQTVQSQTPEGIGSIVQTISDVTAQMSAGGQEMSMTDMIAPQLTSITATLQMTPRGEITNTDFGEVADPAMQEMLSMVEGPASQMNIVFPEGPLAIGDTWSQAIPFDLGQAGMGLTMTATGTYTFLGHAMVNGVQCATLQTAIQIDISGAIAEMGPGSLATGSGQGGGYTYFDNATGKVVQAVMDMTMIMNITVEGQTISQNMSMNMNMTKI